MSNPKSQSIASTPFTLKPRALQDEEYRWTIGLVARAGQRDAAERFVQGFRAAWPSRDELLTITWFADRATDGGAADSAPADTPCDLLFVFDDPTAPDEIASMLQAAANARQTPIRVTDPANMSTPAVQSALSWQVDANAIEAAAADFSLAVFSSFLAKGKVCVDWQDLLILLDAPGRIARITHCQGDTWDELTQAFRAALDGAARDRYPTERAHAFHTTIIDNGSLRMAQVRELVTMQRQHFGEDAWCSYAAPEYHSEQLHAFLLQVI